MNPASTIEERAFELIRLSNSESGLATVRLEYIRCQGSREQSLQDLLGSSAVRMIEAILKTEFPFKSSG